MKIQNSKTMNEEKEVRDKINEMNKEVNKEIGLRNEDEKMEEVEMESPILVDANIKGSDSVECDGCGKWRKAWEMGVMGRLRSWVKERIVLCRSCLLAKIEMIERICPEWRLKKLESEGMECDNNEIREYVLKGETSQKIENMLKKEEVL